ncbi:unnamed protein product [Linum trigynum]|uniref:Uncharacterized protein n=1 Tax=Linum trigynum TaxID=586398 RepID=A0AAV2FWD4_9ROSI
MLEGVRGYMMDRVLIKYRMLGENADVLGENQETCGEGEGIFQDVRLNVADRRTIERELRVATTGVGVYVDERTGNQYVRLNGARGRAVGEGPSQQPRVVQANVVELRGSQPPPSQP